MNRMTTATNKTTTAPGAPAAETKPNLGVGKVAKPELFKLGALLVTPGAKAAFQRVYGKFGDMTPTLATFELLERHVKGDGGDLDFHDKRANRKAIENGERVLSVYYLPNLDTERPNAQGDKLYIITEYHRQNTTILLADEY